MPCELEYTSCYLCGRSDYAPLFTISGFKGDSRTFQAVKCRNCSLVYLNPRYSVAENREIYCSNYFTDTVIDSSGQDRSFIKERRRKVHDHAIEFAYIRRHKSSGTILDLGAATGFFLEAVVGNWQKHALDISSYALDQIEDPAVIKHCGTIHDVKFEESLFDAIYICHTLDRIIDLKPTIAELRRILKPDGIILITVPNIGSLCANVFKEKFRLLYANHLTYFSAATLSSFLEQEGLAVAEVHYPFWGSSFFSWRHLPGHMLAIAAQTCVNLAGGKVVFNCPPFWGNVISVIVRVRNHT